jgi:hypothetical protein
MIMDKINLTKTENFDIYHFENNYSFFHIKINNIDDFMNEFSDYILNEENLIQYIENDKNLTFTLSKRNMALIYKRLNLFIDDEIINIKITDNKIKEIISNESQIISSNSNIYKIRTSKIGRLGEYIFHTLLSKYFKYDCIIPKVALSTDKNMSVYGIDELFYSQKNNMLLFGESKFTKNLDNGIALINKSLESYEQEIKDEFMLVLSETQLKNKLFYDAFSGVHEICISFDEFIDKTDIKNIGIPLFIAHGIELNSNEILNKIRTKIKRNSFFNLNTIYYAISLPIIDKEKIILHFTKKIQEKMEYYKNELSV